MNLRLLICFGAARRARPTATSRAPFPRARSTWSLPIVAALGVIAATPSQAPTESLLVADLGAEAPVVHQAGVLTASLPASLLPESLIHRLAAFGAQRSDPVEVDWRLLAGLNYDTGDMSDDLRAVVGQEARVPGFMVPLEDYLERVTEFLLVPYVGACVHTPPPPPNQLVYVKMPEGERAQVEWWDPIWVEGVLEIETTENIYGSVSYTINGASITSYSD